VTTIDFPAKRPSLNALSLRSVQNTRTQTREGGRMDDDRARELLTRERQRIERAIAANAGVISDDESTIDDADNASDTYQNEFDQGLAEDLQEQLAAVERAEKRLAQGTYGLSIESGNPIPDERLEAVPTAERTVEEEQRFQRGG
jgi:DnaK suppressor protein